MTASVTFLGFGEAGQTFAEALRASGAASVRAYDVLTDDPRSAPAKRADYAQYGVEDAGSAARAVSDANLILSVVAADQALAAATAAGEHISRGAIYCDLNSVAPQTKQGAARLIGNAGGVYADVAVMAPVRPAALGVPLLVSGPRADEATVALESLGFGPRVCGSRIGDAAAIKMLRSIMVKGIEALTAECFLAASRAGVAGAVADSLGESCPGADWLARADYNLERMIVHGERRAAEMDEAAAMLDAWGFPATMTQAAADAQRAIGSRRIVAPSGLDAKADALLPSRSAAA